jgi:hypothetical protein
MKPIFITFIGAISVLCVPLVSLAEDLGATSSVRPNQGDVAETLAPQSAIRPKRRIRRYGSGSALGPSTRGTYLDAGGHFGVKSTWQADFADRTARYFRVVSGLSSRR